MKVGSMLSVEEALARCLELAVGLGPETVPLAKAAGRWMCAPGVATRNQPPFDASAMDGYAVQGDPVRNDSFRIIGEAGAGHAFSGRVGPGETVRIFTGAPVPIGASRVVIQEDVARVGDRITVTGADHGTNIRPQGQDFRVGDSLSPRLLGANDLALLAAMNIARVTVTRKPVVALISTGDELVMPGEDPRPDQIIASNGFALKALVEGAGGEARLLPIARDTEAELQTVLSLTAGADLIVTIGGASVGDHDLVGRVVGFEAAFWKVAMRPGKPLIAGRWNGVPMVGLPGNPVSAIVCGHLFLLPMVRAMLGMPDPAPQPGLALAGVDLPANGSRAHYMRARIAPGEGLSTITPFDRQDSALLSILGEANALLIRPANDGPVIAASKVPYLPL